MLSTEAIMQFPLPPIADQAVLLWRLTSVPNCSCAMAIDQPAANRINKPAR